MSPGRKKETNADRSKPTATKNPFNALSDDEDDLATGYMEVDTVPRVTPAKTTKKKKPAKKSRAQIKAAYMEKAKARAAVRKEQPGATITAPPSCKSTGHQCRGTKGSGSTTQDTAGGQPMEEINNITPCANCLEICKNG